MAVTNAVLITVDSLRADAVSPRSDSEKTPVIGELAERGTVFTNAFAHGNWTPFSFPSILSSSPVFVESGSIGAGARTIAEALRSEGVATAGFNAANGFLTEHWGYDRGFDEFETFVTGSETSPYSKYLAAHPTVQAWLQLGASPFYRIARRLRGEADDEQITDTSRLLDVERRAKAFIRDADSPFFLWVHYMDVHTPYFPAPRHLREVSPRRLSTLRMLRAHARTGLGLAVDDRTLSDLKALYDGTIRQVDASIGRLRAALADTGAADDTLLVVAGDHGEEFLEHGHLAHYPKLYEELIHVPMIVDSPEGGAQALRENVGLESIPPTICDALGVEPPDAWEGASVYPAVRGETDLETDPTVSVTVQGEQTTQQPIPRRPADGDVLVSARTERWTYIKNTATGDRELYDRRADPGEQRDLVDRSDREADEARVALDPIVDAHAERIERERANADADDSVPDDVSDRLTALGYQ
ncbi:sulfatase [Halegenticoccus tardaugens]|uniref:sulfatase n=1 Tax=Halegenticoccus tardaugens TaxID=2071624 RepID=UPI00100B3877|nr:sulfatase [Halegenticoccus tardaugens]